MLIAVAVLMLVYFTAMESLLGATLGKLVAEARVQDVRSERVIGYDAALTRNGMRLIDGIGFYLVGGICAMLTPRKQRLGDLLAHTVVVHRPINGLLRGLGLLLAAGIAAVGIAGGLVLRPEASAGARIESVILSDEPNGSISKIMLAPDVQRIYVSFSLADAPLNTSVKANWFAPGSGPQGGFPLGETEIRTGGIQSGGTFTLEMPPNGWAIGDYRVDLSVNGVLARTERFSIRAVGIPSVSPGSGSPAIAPITATPSAGR